MPEIKITKERYDEIKNKELTDSNLDVYETVDNQDDADDIISSLDYEYIDEDLYIDQETDAIAYEYDPNASFIYTAPDDSKYVDKSAPVAESTGTAFTGGGVSTDCSDIVSNFGKNLRVSRFFTLGDAAAGNFNRIKDKTVTTKSGKTVNFTKYQIACNLKALSVNVLDKIKSQFPDMQINSSIRNWGTRSEHETGQAADLKFPTHKKKDYVIIARWIHQNCAYNQLFLEYRPKENPKGGWIHVSYAASGNQVYGAPKFYGSMYNDSFEAPGSRENFANVMANCDWT
jgi:hypothetical protein